MEKQKCPSVRFKIFNDAWGEKNLANEVGFYSGLTYSPNDITNKSGTLVLRSSNVQNGEISLLDNVYVRPEVAYSQNVDIGDIIVVVRNGSRSLIGKHAIIKKNMINTVIGAFMTGVKSSQPDFINALFDSNNFINQVNKNLGATINQITIGAFKEMSFNFPTVEEQTQIGNFFKNLDQSIALQEKKLTQTQNLKKAMLEKMFPKAGSKQPEIRLKGFSGDWALQPLENIFGKIRNAFVGTATPYYVKSGRFYLESNNVKDGKINRKSEIFINDYFYYKQQDKWLKTNDIVMVQSGHVGHAAVITEELNNSAAHALIMFTDYKVDADPHFINYQIQTDNAKNEIDKITTGNTIKHILSSDMKKFSLLFPCVKEQEKIGHFFKQLDETLALQHQQLQTLKNLKQAFLEKMFV